MAGEVGALQAMAGREATHQVHGIRYLMTMGVKKGMKTWEQATLAIAEGVTASVEAGVQAGEEASQAEEVRASQYGSLSRRMLKDGMSVELMDVGFLAVAAR